MIDSPISQASVSVTRELRNKAREGGKDFQLVLLQYAVERLLYRLSLSRHKDAFVLKGATLLGVWTSDACRSTRDLDLLGYIDGTVGSVEEALRHICSLSVEDDGVVFAPETVVGQEIRETGEYNGVRVKVQARIGTARLTVQVDVGIGDALPAPAEVKELPTLLHSPPPSLKVYPVEASIAEKFHTMVSKDMINSRMKDFYDIAWTSERLELSGTRLQQSLTMTFSRRRTQLPAEVPPFLIREFGKNELKQEQWKAFCRREDLGEISLSKTIIEIEALLSPILQTCHKDEVFQATWQPGRGWVKSDVSSSSSFSNPD